MLINIIAFALKCNNGVLAPVSAKGASKFTKHCTSIKKFDIFWVLHMDVDALQSFHKVALVVRFT